VECRRDSREKDVPEDVAAADGSDRILEPQIAGDLALVAT
jgi:hypothetical protein